MALHIDRLKVPDRFQIDKEQAERFGLIGFWPLQSLIAREVFTGAAGTLNGTTPDLVMGQNGKAISTPVDGEMVYLNSPRLSSATVPIPLSLLVCMNPYLNSPGLGGVLFSRASQVYGLQQDSSNTQIKMWWGGNRGGSYVTYAANKLSVYGGHVWDDSGNTFAELWRYSPDGTFEEVAPHDTGSGVDTGDLTQLRIARDTAGGANRTIHANWYWAAVGNRLITQSLRQEFAANPFLFYWQRKRTYFVPSAGGPAPDLTAGVEFDGSADYYDGGTLTGIADGKEGLVSLWFRPDAAALQYVIGISSGFFVQLAANGSVYIYGENSGSSNVLSLLSAPGAWTAGQWNHLAASWDLATSALHIYINGVEADGGSSTSSNDSIEYTRADFIAGGLTAGGGSKFDGCMGEFYFALEYLDLSNSTNLEKFRSADGNLVSLGSDGSTPTGTAPIAYLSGGIDQFADNFGTGGAFTENGSPADCAIPTFRSALISLSAAIAEQRTVAASLGAAISVEQSASVSLSAAIAAALTASSALQAAIAAQAQASASLSAMIQGGSEATASLDAAIQDSGEAVASLDAAISAEATASAALQAAIQDTANASAALQAAIQTSSTASASIGAFISAPGEGAVTVSLQAAIQEAQSASAALSAAISVSRTASASLGAFVLAGSVVTASFDAAIQATNTATASLSAAISTAQTVSASLGAVVATPGSVTASLRAAVLAQESASASLSAYIQTVGSGFTPSALRTHSPAARGRVHAPAARDRRH